MLEYSPEVKRVSSIFFTHKNDIDIYTEDEDINREFYINLFKKLIRPEIQITNVTPLGTRKNVISACEREPETGRKKIFIIDGDLTIIHGDTKSLNNLFILDSYCIENYLIDEQSVIEYLYFHCGKSREEISNKLDYENWLKYYASHLVNLFLHYAITDCKKINFSLPNIDKFFSITKYGKSFSPDLVQKEIDYIKSYVIPKIGQEEYDSLFLKYSSIWSNSSKDLLTLVSGKEYLIPILKNKAQDMTGNTYGPNKIFIKMFLLEKGKLERLNKLKVKIESLFN